MRSMTRWLWRGLISLIILMIALVVLVYSITFHPRPVQPAMVTCPSETPTLQPDQSIKVLSYNVQYFAGKDYVFYYDLPADAGPDTRPSPEAITRTFNQISQLLLQEDPDVILLQELHDGAAATDHENQTERLQQLLGSRYPCVSEAFYWQADFVPHPAIMGSVGMKLVTLSKTRISGAERRQLSLIPSDPVTQAFNLKRAILTTSLPVSDGGELVVMNTHLDAFSQGTDTMERQVQEVMEQIDAQQSPWLIGGDFNLLPPDQLSGLDASQHYLYNTQTELAPLITRYPSVPSLADVSGADKAHWFTHYPNDPDVSGPDRTIDYVFYSPDLTLTDSYVIQGDAVKYSDHLPVVATFARPGRE